MGRDTITAISTLKKPTTKCFRSMLIPETLDSKEGGS